MSLDYFVDFDAYLDKAREKPTEHLTSIDDMALLQVRISMAAIKNKAFARFKGMGSVQLAIYFLTGSPNPSDDFVGENLNTIQSLINFYVETTPWDFQEDFARHLRWDTRPDEVEETGRGVFDRWIIENERMMQIYEKAEIKSLQQGNRPYFVDGEIIEDEFLSSVMYSLALENHNLLGSRDDLGFKGLTERIHTEKIRVAKKMIWKSQRSEKKR